MSKTSGSYGAIRAVLRNTDTACRKLMIEIGLRYKKRKKALVASIFV